MSSRVVVCTCASVAGVVLLLGGAQTLAQRGAAAGTRVAAVDLVRVFNESRLQRDLTQEMNQARERLEQENRQRRDRIEALQATLDKMDPSDPAFEAKARELRSMQIEYKNWFDINQQEMGREVGLWTVKLYRAILAAIEQVAREQGYDLVLYRDEFEPPSMDPKAVQEQIRLRKLVYASPEVDITAAVLEKLDRDYQARGRQGLLQLPGTAPSRSAQDPAKPDSP